MIQEVTIKDFTSSPGEEQDSSFIHFIYL